MNARERVLREADAELLAPTGTGGLTGAVNSWDLSTGVDGPGTRFVVFTGGCPLRCLYCENPETWRMRGSPRTTVDELMAEIAKYRRFISVAAEASRSAAGSHCCNPPSPRRSCTAATRSASTRRWILPAISATGRTTLCWPTPTSSCSTSRRGLRPSTARLTGRDLAPTLRFAERLAELREPVWVRYVLVPGFTDAPEEVEGVASFVAALPNVEHVDVLPFHRLGAAKYQRLGIPFPLAEVEPPQPNSSPGSARNSEPTASPPDNALTTPVHLPTSGGLAARGPARRGRGGRILPPRSP